MCVSNRLSVLTGLCSLGMAALLSGCAMTSTATPAAATGAAIQGNVHGGSQPVVGSHVHLMAASTTGYGAAATSLLTTGLAGTDSIGGYVLTTSGGGFTITGDYACAPGTQVYALATQGNPGLSAGSNNPNLALMAAIGQCPATGSFLLTVPTIWINEVSTAASVYALSGFMTDLSHVGSSGSPLALTGIANAFATAGNLAGVSTGAALATTPAGNGTAPQAEINTLANIIASCVNSTGAGSSACTTLFSNAMNGTTAPTDTVTAALNIAHNPAANIGALFGLQTAVASPYQPALTSAPNDFTVAIYYTGGGINLPTSVAIDGAGDVWTANAVGTLSKLSPTGAAISPLTGFVGGGLYGPAAIAIDAGGNAWAANPYDFNPLFGQLIAPASVSKFSNAGIPAVGSPFTGGGLSSGNAISPRDIAIDANGNVWVANNQDPTGSVSEMNGTTGAAMSPSGGFLLSSASVNVPQNPSGVAVDSSGHVWVAGNTSNVISEVSVATGAVLFTSAGGANGLQTPYALAIDASGNIWAPNYYDASNPFGDGDTISEFTSAGAAVGVYSGGGMDIPLSVAVDGGGNVWIPNNIGGKLTEFNNSGVALSPSTGFKSSNLGTPDDIAIDPSGNVWAPNAAEASFASGISVVEFVGAAVPAVTPIATAVAGNKLGQRP